MPFLPSRPLNVLSRCFQLGFTKRNVEVFPTKSKTSRLAIRGLSFLIPAFLAALPLSGATIYNETFETSTFGSVNDWRGYNTPTGAIVTAPYGAGITTGSSAPGTNRYMYAQNAISATTTSNYFLYSTSTVAAFAPSTYTGLTASWAKNNGGSDIPTYYLTVQVGSSWYAANTAYTTGTATVGSPLNLLTAQWYDLTFTPNSALSLNTSSTRNYTSLFGAGQTITGLGFYIANLPGSTSGDQYRTIRFDDLVINAVPEPGRAMLMFFGAAFLVTRRRRISPQS